jgi:hypothetical protein
MTDKPDAKPAWGWRKTALTVTGIILFYVLSIGPYGCLHYRGYWRSFPGERYLYLPLVALGDSCRPFANLKQWYIFQWLKLHDALSTRRTTWHDGMPPADSME